MALSPRAANETIIEAVILVSGSQPPVNLNINSYYSLENIGIEPTASKYHSNPHEAQLSVLSTLAGRVALRQLSLSGE